MPSLSSITRGSPVKEKKREIFVTCFAFETLPFKRVSNFPETCVVNSSEKHKIIM